MYLKPYDVYKKFKIQEYISKNKEIKIPKEKNLNRLSKENYEKLQMITDYFNTIWQNINPDIYFEIGFKKWKSFNISKIDDNRIFQSYKIIDKKLKTNFNNINKETIKKSINFLKDNEILSILLFDNNYVVKKIVFFYLQNKIDSIVLCYFIENYKIKLSNEEKDYIPYFMENYSEIKYRMYYFEDFIKEKMMSEKNDDKPYMDDPKKKEKDDETQTEQLIYGDEAETIQEKKKKKKKYKQQNLNE